MTTPFLLSLAAAYAADRLTKDLAVRRLAPARSWPAAVPVQLSLRRKPYPADLGGRGRRLLLLRGAGCLVLLLVLVEIGFFRDQLGQVGLGMALGGAAGNVCDRLRWGAVIDFVRLGPWPVFNLADVAISAGTAAMLTSLIL